MLVGEPFDDLIALAYGWDVLATAALLAAGRVISQITMVARRRTRSCSRCSTARGAVDRWLAHRDARVRQRRRGRAGSPAGCAR